MIVCVCRGATDAKVMEAIDNGASTLLDLQRCGIGDQCGSCHNSLRMMLAAAAEVAARSCTTCAVTELETVAVSA